MNGTVWIAFDGVEAGLTSQTKYTVHNLAPGMEYKFKVTAYNLNGAGIESAEYSFYSCVLPSGFKAPERADSTQTSISI